MVIVGENDVIGYPDMSSRVAFNATPGTTYFICVDGFFGAWDKPPLGQFNLNWNEPPGAGGFQFTSSSYTFATTDTGGWYQIGMGGWVSGRLGPSFFAANLDMVYDYMGCIQMIIRDIMPITIGGLTRG
jgi:hypothetical protein